MGYQFILPSLFTLSKSNKKDTFDVNIKDLPSQGYFYPNDLKIYIHKGNIDDHIIYHQGIGSGSNIFGFISTIKHILSNRICFNLSNFTFNKIRAVDVFFLFILFIKHTTNRRIFFNDIEFRYSNFIYFNFTQFIDNYNERNKTFVFDDWSFSLPTIGIETSLSKFSHEIYIKGMSDTYRNRNYNLIYFLGDKTDISYSDIINLIELFEDLNSVEQNEVSEIVKKFDSVGLYYLVELNKDSVRINPLSLKEIWPIDDSDIYIEYTVD